MIVSIDCTKRRTCRDFVNTVKVFSARPSQRGASLVTYLCDRKLSSAASQYGIMTFGTKVEFLITSSNTPSTSGVTSAKEQSPSSTEGWRGQTRGGVPGVVGDRGTRGQRDVHHRPFSDSGHSCEEAVRAGRAGQGKTGFQETEE